MDHSTEMKHPPSSKLRELWERVDRNQGKIIQIMREAVAIPCLSKNEKYFCHITKMLKNCQTRMEDLGATAELVESQNIKTANDSFYPPVLFGHLFVAEQLKTVCVYGHVDVVSGREDPGNNENFDLVVKNERLHGPGVSLGKGALLCWLNALDIYAASNIEIPINVKFIVDGTAAIFSPILEDVISRKKDFFLDIDYTCLMIDKKRSADVPCVGYGYRGLCHFSLDINCGKSDIDSGDYGGGFDQPLMDAVRIVSSLMDKHDKLAVPNISREVDSSKREKKLMEKGLPDIDDIKRKIGVKRLRHKEIPSRIFIHKTQLPSISVHGFHTNTDYNDSKNRAIIPCRTVVKFSITFANDEKAADIRTEIENHVKNVWNRHKCVNEYGLNVDACIDQWKDDPTDSHYKAAAKAIKSVYHKEPLYVKDGSSAAAASILKTACPHGSSLVLSLGESYEPDGKDEFVSIENYLKSVKVVIAYMCYVNEL